MWGWMVSCGIQFLKLSSKVNRILNSKHLLKLITLSAFVLLYQNCSQTGENSFQRAPTESQEISVDETKIILISEPLNAQRYVGDRLELTVSAKSGKPLQYQWRKDGEDIVGANHEVYIVTSVSLSDAGSYSVRIQNDVTSVETKTVSIEVTVPPPQPVAPIIVEQPQSKSLYEGDSLSLSVSASGVPDPSYQWQKDGHSLENEKSNSLSVTSATKSHSGVYQVKVSNAKGSVMSDPAVVQILSYEAPSVVKGLSTVSLNETQPLSAGQFCIEVKGTLPIAYTWKKDQLELSDKKEKCIELTSVKLADSGIYEVTASNKAGSVKSSASLNIIKNCLSTEHNINNVCVSNTRSCAVPNGMGQETWNGTVYVNCKAVSCNNGYHVEGGACLSNVKACTILNGTGQQKWDGSKYVADGVWPQSPTCGVMTCHAGYQPAINSGVWSCQLMTQPCSVVHGIGIQTWNGKNFGTCQVSQCNNGYSLFNNTCIPTTQSCPIPNGTGQQRWDGSKYVADGVWPQSSTCGVMTCASGAHISSSGGVWSCQLNIQTCTVSHGQGTQTWMGSSFGVCQVKSCDLGYNLFSNTCMSTTQSCSVPNGTGKQKWDGSKYVAEGRPTSSPTCGLVACQSGYHGEEGTGGIWSCQLDVQACSIEGGAGVKKWDGLWMSNCEATSCVSGYTLYHSTCKANTQACSIPNGTGQQRWDGSKYVADGIWPQSSTCGVMTCQPGYHIANFIHWSCDPNVKSCYVENGTGTETWNGSNYGTCQVTSCESGYRSSGKYCEGPCTDSVGTGYGTHDYGLYGRPYCDVTSCPPGFDLVHMPKLNQGYGACRPNVFCSLHHVHKKTVYLTCANGATNVAIDYSYIPHLNEQPFSYWDSFNYYIVNPVTNGVYHEDTSVLLVKK